MPLLLAPFVAALLGVALALAGRDEIRRTTLPAFATRGFLVTVVVSVALWAPSLGYFVAFYPDWSYAYLVAGGDIPSAVHLVEIAAVAAVPAFTYAWTASALRRHAVRELVRSVSVVTLLLASTLVLLGPRLLVLTTRDAYRDGLDGHPITGTSLGLSILWVDGCVAAGMAFAATQLRRLGRAS